ncbi:MAG: hypothetical protein ACFB5Z_02620 [Elainellaceae cyanobacterium]
MLITTTRWGLSAAGAGAAAAAEDGFKAFEAGLAGATDGGLEETDLSAAGSNTAPPKRLKRLSNLRRVGIVI